MSENTQVVKLNYVQTVLQQAGFHEEDVREFCKENKLGYLMLWSHHRRITTMNADISFSDTIYTVQIAAQNGLPPFGEWYTPIARRGGKGFTLCFRYDAALYILNHHKDMKGKIEIAYRDGKGAQHGQDYSPSWRVPNDVDWGMSCSVKANVSGQEVSFSCPYRQWVQYGQDGNITHMWLHKAGHMLMKQAIKEFVRLYLGATLIFEDHYGHAEQERLIDAPAQDDVPAITINHQDALPTAISEPFEATVSATPTEKVPAKRGRKAKEPVIERAQTVEENIDRYVESDRELETGQNAIQEDVESQPYIPDASEGEDPFSPSPI